MADTSSTTITSKEYSSGIKIVTCVFVADETVATTLTACTLGAERGKELVNVFTKGVAATGFTDNCDLSITDSITGRNLVATNGANSVDNNATNYVVPETESIVIGELVVDPDAADENAVTDGICTVYLVFKSRFC